MRGLQKIWNGADYKRMKNIRLAYKGLEKRHAANGLSRYSSLVVSRGRLNRLQIVIKKWQMLIFRQLF